MKKLLFLLLLPMAVNAQRPMYQAWDFINGLKVEHLLDVTDRALFEDSVVMSGLTAVQGTVLVIDGNDVVHTSSIPYALESDSSKWTLSGNNIYNKNSGNVGIGVTSPATKFNVAASSDVLFGTALTGTGTKAFWKSSVAAFRAGNVTSSWDADSLGTYSAAFNLKTTALGQASFACNRGAAYGGASFAQGSLTHADGVNAMSSGSNTIAYGDNSFAGGRYTVAQSYCSVAIGRTNVALGNANTWVPTDPVFQIGVGDSVRSLTPVDGFVVYKNGAAKAMTDAANNLFTIGGVLNVNTTAVGNVGVGEDDLIQYTMSAGALGDNGDYIVVEGAGTTGANGNNKEIKIYLGARVIYDTGVVTWNNLDWHFRATIIRTGAGTQICSTEFLANGIDAGTDYTTAAISLSGSIIIKLTGEATANSDILQQFMVTKYND